MLQGSSSSFLGLIHVLYRDVTTAHLIIIYFQMINIIFKSTAKPEIPLMVVSHNSWKGRALCHDIKQVLY